MFSSFIVLLYDIDAKHATLAGCLLLRAPAVVDALASSLL